MSAIDIVQTDQALHKYRLTAAGLTALIGIAVVMSIVSLLMNCGA